MSRSGLWMAAAAYTGWGLLSPVGKTLLESFPPMTINAVRMVLGMLLVLAAVPADARRQGLALLGQWRIALLLVFGVGVQFTLFLYAVERTAPAFATLGFFTAPLWTAIIARAVLGEHLDWTFPLAITGLLGGGYLALFGTGSPQGFAWTGVLLAVGSGLGWGIYAVGLRKVAPGLSLRPLMVASFIANSLYFLAGALVLEARAGVEAIAAADAQAWAWMAIYIAVPTIASLFLFNESLRRASASHVNMLVGLELVATVFFAWWIRGDTFTAAQLLGVGLVIVAVTAYLAYGTRVRAAGRAGSAA